MGQAASSDLSSVLEGVGVDRRQEFLAKLQDMTEKNQRFRHVAIWRQAFLGGTVDHHTLVYEYPLGQAVMSLKVDWGREGLAFEDSVEDPCPNGDIITRKFCRLHPSEVREQFLLVCDQEYDLARWNCQHFSRYMYDQADAAYHKKTKPGVPLALLTVPTDPSPAHP